MSQIYRMNINPFLSDLRNLINLWFSSLPPTDCSIEVVILVAKPLGDFLIAGFFCVQVESVENGESLLGVPVLGVGHPAAGLHLVAVQPPVLQLLLKERPAHVGGVVELPSPVVVEDLTEHPRVSAVERIYWIEWLVLLREHAILS